MRTKNNRLAEKALLTVAKNRGTHLALVLDAGVHDYLVDAADLRPVLHPQQRPVVLGLEKQPAEATVPTYPARIEGRVVHGEVVLEDGALVLALPVHRRKEVLGVGLEDDPLESGRAESRDEDRDDDEISRIEADRPAQLPEQFPEHFVDDFHPLAHFRPRCRRRRRRLKRSVNFDLKMQKDKIFKKYSNRFSNNSLTH